MLIPKYSKLSREKFNFKVDRILSLCRYNCHLHAPHLAGFHVNRFNCDQCLEMFLKKNYHVKKIAEQNEKQTKKTQKGEVFQN